MTIDLGGGAADLVLQYCGAGTRRRHRGAGCRAAAILFAGDLVEAQAALYTGDAFHADWSSSTLDAVAAFGRRRSSAGAARWRAALRCGRRDRTDPAFLAVDAGAHPRGARARRHAAEAFEARHAALAPTFGKWPIFEHCMPFNVQRLWDELDGVDWPRIWTAERDREVWAAMQG
jgi:hypothetical protein